MEYGESDRCEQKTPIAEISSITGQPYWTHFHRLRELKPQTTYYYRLANRGTDGSTSIGQPQTFQTKRYARAIRIPEQLPGPPYVLNQPNTTYLLSRDLTFPLGGLLIKAEGITLDMDGHRLLYNDEKAERPSEWDKRAYEGYDFGIKIEGRVHATILNGSICQGRGNTAGTAVGVGCNPIYSLAAANEIGGVDITWTGDDVSGFFLHYSDHDHVHHCVIDDRGDAISDRHMAIRSISGNIWGDYDHNLVRATRQQALANGVHVTHNEIYLRSCATNSFGITPTAEAKLPVEIADNHIVGVGEHPVGIGMFGAYLPGSTVHHNWVEVKCTKSGAEYGYTGCACFRTTWGADQLDVGANTFIAHADVYHSQPSKARAVWVGLPQFTPKGGHGPIGDARGFFHDNLIVARGPEKAPAGGICIVCLNQSPNLIFTNNRVVSTWGNVLLADNYGHADGYAKLAGNIFEREGSTADYFTVRQQYGGIPATGVFLRNQFPAGEPALKVLEKGELVFQEAINIAVKDSQGRPLGGAAVAIRDASGRDVFAGVTPDVETPAMLASHPGPVLAVDSPPHTEAKGYIESLVLPAGQLTVILTTQVVTAAGKSTPGPYTLRISKGGFQDASQPLPLGKSPAIEVTLLPGK